VLAVLAVLSAQAVGPDLLHASVGRHCGSGRWWSVDAREDATARELGGLTGGSGYKQWCGCSEHKASGHVACSKLKLSAYTSVQVWTLQPVHPADGANAALSMVWPTCDMWSMKDPAHASISLLDPPVDGGVDLTTHRWWPGRPQRQRPACISWTEPPQDVPARILLNDAADWNEPPESGPIHLLRYRPAPVTESLFGRGDRFWLAASSAHAEVWVDAHAVAVYCTATDQHAWAMNLERQAAHDGPFKADRWPTIASVSIDGPTVTVHRHGEGPPVQVLLPPDCQAGT